MVRLPLSRVYISNVYSDRMYFICEQKKSVICNITIFGILLAVTMQREVSLADYQVKTGLSNVVPSSVATKTTHYDDVIMSAICVSTHQPHDCLFHRLFRRRSKKTSKFRVTDLCAGNSPVTGEFPAQMASNAENFSIWWRHHAARKTTWFLPVWWSINIISTHNFSKFRPAENRSRYIKA